MSEKATKSAVTYLRVSTTKQGQSGLGLEAQRETVTKHLSSAGLELRSEYVEVESGKRKVRPQLEAALAEAKKRKAVLVVAKTDRLSRETKTLLAIVDSGVDILFCDMPILAPGAAGRFQLTLLAAAAEYEAGLISTLKHPVKVLARGEADRSYSVHAHAFSATAREKIEAAGASVQVIE